MAIDQGAASIALGDMARRTSRLQILITSSYRLVDKDKIGNLLPNEAVEAAVRVSQLLNEFRNALQQAWTCLLYTSRCV